MTAYAAVRSPRPAPNTWHNLALTFSGSTLTAAARRRHGGDADRHDVERRAGRHRYQPGRDGPVRQPVGHRGRRAAAAGVRPTGRRRQSGRCLDVPSQARPTAPRSRSGTATAAPTSSGPRRPTARCRSTAPSAWTCSTRRRRRVRRSRIWDCNGGANQRWTVNADGTIVGAESGLCLDVTGQATGNGTRSRSGPATAAPTSAGTADVLCAGGRHGGSSANASRFWHYFPEVVAKTGRDTTTSPK